MSGAATTSLTFEIPAAVREQIGLTAPEPARVAGPPPPGHVVLETRAPAYTVQVVVNLHDAKKGRRVTHGRSIEHAYDNRRDPGTFCGKPWRHPDHGYVYFDVIANVDRAEALERISCVACQVELA